MKPSRDIIDPFVEQKLDLLHPVPPRDPEIAGLGRAKFLAQARSMAPAVSPSSQRRHNGWIINFKSVINRKERSPMLATLTSVLLVVSILLGGTGVTVYAAQESLPDQPLYALKTFTEDLRLRLNSSEQVQLNLDLEFAERRVQEMIALSVTADPPPDAVLERLKLHLNLAFQHAAGLDDESFPPAVVRIQQKLQVQEQKLIQAREQAASLAEAQLSRAQEMVQLRLRLLEDGLHDPMALRERLRDPEHLRLHTGTGTPPGGIHHGPHQTQNGSGYGPALTEEPTQGSGYGPRPGPDETAQPGSGYGPGPRMTASPDPGDGYGPGPNTSEQNQTGKGDGSGPHPTEDPGGHQSGGPPPADDSDNHHGPGTQPTEDSGGKSGPAPQDTQPMGPGGGQGGRP